MTVTGYDFGGYATKTNVLCTDGRTIQKGAFSHNDGQKIPLVWQHLHGDAGNVLGHGILEERPDGMYVYGFFNNGDSAKQAKELLAHKDIESLSIFANQLVERGKLVHKGDIKEVSLVLSGANPGAKIDYLSFAHGDESMSSEDEAIITFGSVLDFEEKSEIKHEATTPASEETVEDVFKTLSEKQQKVVYALIGAAMERDLEQSDLEHDNQTISGDETMKQNVFDKPEDPAKGGPTLTHDQIATIFQDAPKYGSLKESFLAHVGEYGITNIDYLFPDAQAVTNAPTFVQRDMAWVGVFMAGTKHTPFSRIKSLTADITESTARALGYIKGSLKKEEFFELAKRVTIPSTIYKKQKLDRDDLIDITSFDVVAWLKGEMRMMLDEEIARACLLGDGRAVDSLDKISETNIRPVYKDAILYTNHVILAAAKTTAEIIDEIIKARKDYKGTGNPVLWTTAEFHTDMLLLKDTTGRRLYKNDQELAAELRVSSIVEVEVMEGISRDVTTPAPATYNLLGVLLNPIDYTIGADNGGKVAMFDDFDIDYNQYKYLIETRISGCLVKPRSAVVIEQATA